jgi:hypothetical protein
LAHERGSLRDSRGGGLFNTTGAVQQAAAAVRRLVHARPATSRLIPGLFEMLSLEVEPSGGSGADLISILLDLTFYEHTELVEAALELLVRHYQQRDTLCKYGLDVKLLAKPEVVQHYMRCDQLLRQLQRLANRRRLLGMERSRAVQLLGLLTKYCYEDARAVSSARPPSKKARSPRRSPTKPAPSASRNPSDGLYLLLVGRAMASLGSNQMLMLPELAEDAWLDETLSSEDEMRAPMPFPPIYDVPAHNPCNRRLRSGDRVVIEGGQYKVMATEEVLSTGAHGVPATALSVTLDRPLALELPSGHKGVAPVPPALQATGSGHVWVMLQCRSPAMNVDCQLLLLSMGAHDVAIQLLKTPFVLDEVRADELEVRAVRGSEPRGERSGCMRVCSPRPHPPQVRAVCLAAYRLIKAMAIGCPKAQLALLPSLPTFVAMTSATPSAALLCVDVSPMMTIQTIYHGNHTVCAQDSAHVKKAIV